MARLHEREQKIGVTQRLTLHKNAHVQTDNPMVGAGSAYTVRKLEDQAPRTVTFDTAAGSTITLPGATGSGRIYRFVVTTLATTNSHILEVANATDIFEGSLSVADVDVGGTGGGFFANGSTHDTITFNRTTTGLAAIGDFIEVQDIAVGVFAVRGQYQASGTIATPFSAAVS